MKKRSYIRNTKIGDILEVPLDGEIKGYIQYIISDYTQLNSDVIRTFKKRYPLSYKPSFEEITRDDVEFYAHCVTKSGIHLGLWKVIGNSPDIGGTDHILFRGSLDYGSGLAVSENWYVWHINKEHIHVGKLEGENRNAEIGLVFAPINIVGRMKTGIYPIKYIDFE